MKKVFYSLIGLAAAIIIISTAYLCFAPGSGPTLKPEAGRKPAAPAFRVNKVADGSFGSLSGATAAGSEEDLAQNSSAATEAPMNAAAPFGLGGGGGALQPNSAPVAGRAAKIMPPMPYKTYKYVYKGGDFQVQDKMEVLKRIKAASLNLDMADLLRGLNFGLGDLSTFADLDVQNLNLVQKSDFGYVINIFPEEGSISLYQNWETWPAGKCGGDSACYEAQQVKEGDVLSDAEAIRIADDFLAAHNIDKSIYGDPEISNQRQFRIYGPLAPEGKNFYLPETLEVVYPLKIGGKFVYDEYNGNKQGLTVQINVKNKKVAGLYNLNTQDYQSSAYEMETDTQKLIAYAEKGGVNNYQSGDSGDAIELELGDPEVSYINYFEYKDGKNGQLLVPALYFPIKNPPEDTNFYRQGVVVPLAKEILAERGDGGGTVAPLMRGAGSVGAGAVESSPLKK